MKIKYVQLDSSAFFTDLDFIAMTLEERARQRRVSIRTQRCWAPLAMGISQEFQPKTLIPKSKNQNFCNFFYSFLHKHLGGLAT